MTTHVSTGQGLITLCVRERSLWEGGLISGEETLTAADVVSRGEMI